MLKAERRHIGVLAMCVASILMPRVSVWSIINDERTKRKRSRRHTLRTSIRTTWNHSNHIYKVSSKHYYRFKLVSMMLILLLIPIVFILQFSRPNAKSKDVLEHPLSEIIAQNGWVYVRLYISGFQLIYRRYRTRRRVDFAGLWDVLASTG